jgi:hypothetical protein
VSFPKWSIDGGRLFAAFRHVDLPLGDEAVQGARFNGAETAIAGSFQLKNKE